MSRTLFLLVILALLALPLRAAAQGRAGSVELGFDGGFEFSNVEDLELDDDGDEIDVEFGDRFDIGVPIQRFRVGYHASDLISIEPSIGLDYFKIEDPTDDGDDADVSQTNLNLALALLVHFRGDPDIPVAYGLLRGTYNLTDVNLGDDDDDDDLPPGLGGEDSASQLGLGVGVGVKLPVADRLDVRLEGSYERRFENEDDFLPSSNNYILNVGFSWYTGSR